MSLASEQFKKYRPRKPEEGSWLAEQSLAEAGWQYTNNRRRIAENLARGYNVKNLSKLNYRGPGEHSYLEHQAIITRGHIIEHNEAVDVLAHVHGIDVGALDYFHDDTRLNVTQQRRARSGRSRERTSDWDEGADRRISWE